MLRRLQRPAAALVPLVLLAPVLSACGSSGSTSSASPSASASTSAGKALDEVAFSGAVGKSIKATWTAAVKPPSSVGVTTLIKGTGAKIADGDTVSTYLWIGNGAAKKAAFSDYDKGAPESVPNNGQLNEIFTKILGGATYGSRVAAVAKATDLFGPQGNQQLGIAPADSIVLVADLVKKAPTAPTPSSDKVKDAPPASLPSVVSKGGKPTGLDWSGIKKPALTTPVQRVILKKGTGAAVKATDTVTVNYLGETYKATKPFDESYTKKPLTAPLSGLVPGWTIGLTGVKVGSRVLLQMPPAFGYGAAGSGDIPGNATLWFVIDVVKTAKG